MSVNFTVRIPKKLAERMRKHSEINWSEVVRRSIEEYLRMLEGIKYREHSEELIERLGVSKDDLRPMSADEEMRMYELMREREWKRLSSMTQAQ
jgi:Arc/MetJ-type ribon-helix-helix transcriptional regulator